MTSQQITNLKAFTKLYGYIRFFYPGDETMKINWDKFAIYGVNKISTAKNTDELIKKLTGIFQPIAPLLKIYKTNENIADTIFIQQNSENLTQICWKHFGIGFKKNEQYKSYISCRGINKKELSSDIFKEVEKFPQANELYKTNIGNTISISMPLALYKNNTGTLPHSDENKLNNLIEDIENNLPVEINGNDINVRLAGIVIAWNIFQHFFPYFDISGTDWESTPEPALIEAADDTDEFSYLLTLKKFTAKLNDGHVIVDHIIDNRNKYFPSFNWEWIEDNLVITKVLNEAEGKLEPGDIVKEINDEQTMEALMEEEQYVSGATIQWKRNRYKRSGIGNSIMRLLSGEKDSMIKLKIKRDFKELCFEFKRTHTDVNPEPSIEKICEITSGVFYFDLARCNDNDFNNYLPKFEKAKGLIFDMRGYPRSMTPIFLQHIVKEHVTSAYWLIPLNVFPDRRWTRFNQGWGRWDLEPLKPYLNAKIAFITDGRAISYAESLLGIVEYYKLAEIIGEPTAGTNGDVNHFTLPGDYDIRFTGLKVLKHNGSPHHGIGILPTMPAPKTIKSVIEKRDIQLEKAIKVVSK